MSEVRWFSLVPRRHNQVVRWKETYQSTAAGLCILHEFYLSHRFAAALLQLQESIVALVLYDGCSKDIMSLYIRDVVILVRFAIFPRMAVCIFGYA